MSLTPNDEEMAAVLSVDNSPQVLKNNMNSSPSTSKQEIKIENKKYSKFESSPEPMDEEEDLIDDDSKTGEILNFYVAAIINLFNQNNLDI